jgi:hypothetical protein
MVGVRDWVAFEVCNVAEQAATPNKAKTLQIATNARGYFPFPRARIKTTDLQENGFTFMDPLGLDYNGCSSGMMQEITQPGRTSGSSILLAYFSKSGHFTSKLHGETLNIINLCYFLCR